MLFIKTSKYAILGWKQTSDFCGKRQNNIVSAHNHLQVDVTVS